MIVTKLERGRETERVRKGEKIGRGGRVRGGRGDVVRWGYVSYRVSSIVFSLITPVHSGLVNHALVRAERVVWSSDI